MASKIIVDQLEKTGGALTALTLPVANATANQHLKNDGAGALSWVTPAGTPLFTSFAIIADQKAAGTDGGTFTSGSWQTRDLQTEITDIDGIVTISANEFTLAAGTYLINWNCCAFQCNSHKSRLYDVTGTASLGMGMPQWTQSLDHGSNNSEGSTRITPSGSNVYRIEHRCSLTKADQGFGVPADFSEPEIFTRVEIYKES